MGKANGALPNPLTRFEGPLRGGGEKGGKGRNGGEKERKEREVTGEGNCYRQVGKRVQSSGVDQVQIWREGTIVCCCWA